MLLRKAEINTVSLASVCPAFRYMVEIIAKTQNLLSDKEAVINGISSKIVF